MMRFRLVIGWALPCMVACSLLWAANPRDEVHSWWVLSQQQQREYFAQGRARERKGENSVDLLLATRSSKQIGGDIELDSAALSAPPYALRSAGAYAEHRMMADDQMDELMSQVYKECSEQVTFAVYLTSRDHLDRLLGVSFALEAPTGDPEEPTERVAAAGNVRPDTNVGRTTRTSWFNAHYRPQFPLKSRQGRPYVSKATEWLRLWIVTLDQKTPVTFYIDGSDKIVVGEPQ
jgi:hypothetical protein